MSDRIETDLITIGRAVELLQQAFPDVTVSSLRFLEREGLLAPQRKPGGHRLYSAADLERAGRIKRWQAERLSLKEIRRRLEQAPEAENIPQIVKRMTSLLLNEDIFGALAILEEVQRSGTPLITMCDHILTPVLRNLGDDQGNHLIPVDVQMELDEQLITFFSRVTSDPGHLPGMPIVVAACPPWERHDLPLRMLVALLAERGSSVHFIGAQVDDRFVRDAIARLNPDFVLISLTVRPPENASVWFQSVIASMQPHQRLYVGGIGSQFIPESDTRNMVIPGMETYANTLEMLLCEKGSDAPEH